MRVQVEPRRVEMTPGVPFTIGITVTNTTDIIGGYQIRVLGADPGWVQLADPSLSLFPEETRTVFATVTPPSGLGAGDRRFAVQVRELTAPGGISVQDIDLVVPAQEALRMTLSPMTVMCGNTGRFGVVAENTGNTIIRVRPVGVDPQAKLEFRFSPAEFELAPGEQLIADLQATRRRPWFGSPVVRQLGVGMAPTPTAVPVPVAAEPVGAPVKPTPVEPLTQGSMVQKPRLGRGALSLLSLLVAVSVFALVITIALSRLVTASANDRNLALQVATARDGGGATGSSGLAGTVTLLADGSPAEGVAVEIFDAGTLGEPILTRATTETGAWEAAELPAGSYKLRFLGAGFAEIWYPSALTGADAEALALAPGQQLQDLAVTLGGLPATISGEVVGEDVAGAVLTLSVPAGLLPRGGELPDPTEMVGPVGDLPVVTGAPADQADTAPTVSAAPPSGEASGEADGAAADAGNGGVVRTVPIGSDGTFTLDDVVSPSVYDLTVSKPGFAGSTQRVDLSGGESRTGVQLRLRSGDGLVSGTVTGPDGPLGDAIVTATSGSTTISTVSLTTGDIGTFTLRGLVTPATWTITVSKDGFTTQSSTVSLTQAQKRPDLDLALSASAGALSGTVRLLADDSPAAGVSVTVTAGETTVATVTQSTGTIGSWTVGGLPLPGSYTVTFSRADLQSQTVAVSMDATGAVSGGTSTTSVDVAMKSSSAVIQGTVSQRNAGGQVVPIGEADVLLTSGTQEYKVRSASQPADQVGRYEITGVAPGTYTLSVTRTGTSPTTVIVTVAAGQIVQQDPVLIQPASITGRVVSRDGGSTAGLQVALYQSARYPAESYRTTVTDDTGAYSFPDVDAPQAYVVEVRSAAGTALGSASTVLGASQALDLDLLIGTAPPACVPDPTTGGGCP